MRLFAIFLVVIWPSEYAIYLYRTFTFTSLTLETPLRSIILKRVNSFNLSP